MADNVELDGYKKRPFGIEHQEAIQLFPEITTVNFGKDVTIIVGGGSPEETNKPLDLQRIHDAMDPKGGTGFESKNSEIPVSGPHPRSTYPGSAPVVIIGLKDENFVNNPRVQEALQKSAWTKKEDVK